MDNISIPTEKISFNNQLTNNQIVTYIRNNGFLAKFLNSSFNSELNFEQCSQQDILLIYLSNSLLESDDMASLNRLVKNSSQVIIGLVDDFNESLFHKFIKIGIKEFIFNPITSASFHHQINPLINELINKRERILTQLKLDTNLSHICNKQCLSLSINNHLDCEKECLISNETMRQSFSFVSNKDIISSSFVFKVKFNQIILCIVGQGRDNSIDAALDSAEIQFWLKQESELINSPESIVMKLRKHKTMSFEIAVLNCQTKELRYYGENNLLIFRNEISVELENLQKIKIQPNDSMVLFNKGCLQQKNNKNKDLDKETFIGFLQLIALADNKVKRQKLNYFYDAWLDGKPQDENIALLSFGI